jgi:hypothetical protein
VKLNLGALDQDAAVSQGDGQTTDVRVFDAEDLVIVNLLK